MKLIFFDESKNDSAYKHYHIGAVCIDESHIQEIESEVADIADHVFHERELKRETELHACDIYHRKNNFKSFSDFSYRTEVIGKFLPILSRDEVQLVDVQINCDLLSRNQSAEEIAFMFLCERTNALVKAQRSYGLLIGDRESDNAADRFARTLSGYRARSTEFAFGQNIHNLVDSVHFTHSHLSRLLQLADVYTWILQFKNRHRESGDRRHQDMMMV